jgi:hypothetical protein
VRQIRFSLFKLILTKAVAASKAGANKGSRSSSMQAARQLLEA